jgi:hypothetical protein
MAKASVNSVMRANRQKQQGFLAFEVNESKDDPEIIGDGACPTIVQRTAQLVSFELGIERILREQCERRFDISDHVWPSLKQPLRSALKGL